MEDDFWSDIEKWTNVIKLKTILYVHNPSAVGNKAILKTLSTGKYYELVWVHSPDYALFVNDTVNLDPSDVIYTLEDHQYLLVNHGDNGHQVLFKLISSDDELVIELEKDAEVGVDNVDRAPRIIYN